MPWLPNALDKLLNDILDAQGKGKKIDITWGDLVNAHLNPPDWPDEDPEQEQRQGR